jgi:dTDP-4-dehydrorhamnose 3,5-epimerase
MKFTKTSIEGLVIIEPRVLDVAIDIRKEDPTYGKHVAIELSGENKK